MELSRVTRIQISWRFRSCDLLHIIPNYWQYVILKFTGVDSLTHTGTLTPSSLTWRPEHRLYGSVSVSSVQTVTHDRCYTTSVSPRHRNVSALNELGLPVWITTPTASRNRHGEPVWPSGKALGWSAEGPRFDSASALLFLQKVEVCGYCLVTLSLTINKTLKQLSLLPLLMQNHSGGDSVALGIVSIFSQLLGSRSPPGRQIGAEPV